MKLWDLKSGKLIQTIDDNISRGTFGSLYFKNKVSSIIQYE